MKISIFSLLLLASSAFAQVTLTSVEYAGAGCPQGHVNVVLTPDGSSFSILYDAYDLRVDLGVRQAQSTCEITLHVRKPRKMGIQIEEAEFRGFVALDSGVTATQKVQVMTGPNHGHQQLSAEFGTQVWQGPVSDNYSLRAVRAVNKRPGILDCVPPREDTDILVNSQVQLINSGVGKFGQVTVDSVDGIIVQKFVMKLINCKK